MTEPCFRVIHQFHDLHRAIIDASSIIYMQKARFLEALWDEIHLFSPPDIVAETGYHHLKIRPLHCESVDSSNDEKLIACGFRTRWPVISEDRGVLSALKEGNIPHFNALVMLNFLLFRKRIRPEVYGLYYGTLRECAWYSPQVLEFGESLHRAVTNE